MMVLLTCKQKYSFRNATGDSVVFSAGNSMKQSTSEADTYSS
jgi:hypothetical protein